MFSSIYGFAKRHRKAFFISAGVLGGVYWVGQYAKKKITEMQAAMARDRLLQENLKRRFEQNQQDCTFTIMSLLPTLSEPLLDTMNVEKLVQTLKEYRKGGSINPASRNPPALPAVEGGGSSGDDPSANLSNPASPSPAATTTLIDPGVHHPARSKVELWEDIKLTSFTRTLTSLYCLNYLTVFVYLQLNLIGRFIYADSLASLVRGSPSADDTNPQRAPAGDSMNSGKADPHAPTSRRLPFMVEQAYLTLTWWFLHIGWQSCQAAVETAVHDVFSTVSLKAKLTHFELVDLIGQVRERVEHPASGPASDRSTLHHPSDTNPHTMSPGSTSSNLNGDSIIVSEDLLLPTDPDDLERTLLEGGANPRMLTDPTLLHIVAETRDFLDSPDFRIVCGRCLDRTFAVLFDTLLQYFPAEPVAPQQQQQSLHHSTSSTAPSESLRPNAPSTSDLTASFQASATMPTITTTAASDISATQSVDLVQEFENFSSVESRLAVATIIPRVTREVHQILNGFPNNYLEVITAVPELQAFSAVIYTSLEL
ncbi:Peroxin-3 [Dimargaris cristalligena]|uniref:Peroxin-3 n=1 Tax=Dimargaris cristalligena TaxID=215637 RepID=A0A4V1J492_9FUNG|nr:Peroxin-3 [Dimargaris cristalligena]|eukprot:RKP34749.1 Peroxin-3 [Dimargaris cristalligena]